MSGTVKGGKKASITNKQKHGEDFYKRIGRKGGKVGGLKGFALNPELARTAGRKGGSISRRGKSKKVEATNQKKPTIISYIETPIFKVKVSNAKKEINRGEEANSSNN